MCWLPEHLGWLWFCKFDLDDTPKHSVSSNHPISITQRFRWSAITVNLSVDHPWPVRELWRHFSKKGPLFMNKQSSDAEFGLFAPNSEYWLRIEQSVRHNRIPLAASIELTYRCNFRCCYCFQIPIRGQATKELPWIKWKYILDSLRDCGCLFLHLTGGEVAIYRNFLDLYNYAYKKGFLIRISSNGSLLSSCKAVEVFRKRPPLEVNITLYGASSQTYQAFAHAPKGSWESVQSSIRSLIEAKINVRLTTIINKITYDDLPDMKHFAEKVGVPFFVHTSVTPFCDGDATPRYLQLGSEKCVEALKFNKQIDEFTEYLRREDKLWVNGKKKCFAGISQCYIDPTGCLFLCRVPIGKRWPILDHGFAFCWNQIAKERSKLIEKKIPCGSCENRMYCGLCRPSYCRDYGAVGSLEKRCLEGMAFKRSINKALLRE